MKNFKPFYLTLIFVSIGFLGIAQMDTIHFYNPSFEGNPNEGGSRSLLPKGWTDCGFRGETAPDVHPVRGGNFSVSKRPAHGRTYIGMVTRDNDTWEQMGQRLTKPLKAGKCYTFSVDLARSETYLSQSRVTGQPSNYVNPTSFRFHGSNGNCEKEELLAVSPLIKNTRWLKYDFVISPTEDYEYIVVEAYYKTPTLYPSNGNILVDNLSPLIEIQCDSDGTQAEIDSLRKKVAKYSNSSPKNLKTDEEKLLEIKREEAQRLAYERKNASKNLMKEKMQLLVKQGLFDSNNQETNRNSTEVLNDILKLLKSNPKLGVQFGVKKGANRNWKIAYLRETFHANEIPKKQYDIDKFSKFVEDIWEANNENIAVDVYRIF